MFQLYCMNDFLISHDYFKLNYILARAICVPRLQPEYYDILAVHPACYSGHYNYPCSVIEFIG